MNLEDKCPDCKTIQGVEYCEAFNTECRTMLIGKDKIQIVKFNRPYGNYEQILLCDGNRQIK